MILQLKDYGRTRRGWLGVRIQAVTEEIAESLGLNSEQGALVASVAEGGPAAKAQIKPGDVILRFDSKLVDEMRRLPRIVAETPIGKEVPVVVWRNENEVRLTVSVGELEETESAAVEAEGEAETGKIESLGMGLATLSSELRERFELGEDVQGVVVTDVDDASEAASKGVRPGDVIVEVGQEEVRSPADVETRVRNAQKAGRKSVLVLLERAGELRFVAIRIGES